MKKLVEMLRTGFKEKQYIIEDLINPGAYVLAGAPKCGKTILATQLAVAVNIAKFHIHIYIKHLKGDDNILRERQK